MKDRAFVRAGGAIRPPDSIGAAETRRYRIAGHAVALTARYARTRAACGAYLDADGRVEPEAAFEIEAETLRALCPGADAQLRADVEFEALGSRFYWWLLTRGGLCLHASALTVDGGAYLFCAPSGTGKSTHARLWRETLGAWRALPLNDDKPLLTLSERGVTAWGAPWCGKDALGRNACAPVAGIALLSRAEETRVRPLAPADAAARLLSQTLLPDDAALADAELALAGEILARVPLWELACTKDANAARIAFAAMRRP